MSQRPITPPGEISSIARTQEQLNNEFLVGYGYAPGNYMGTCRYGDHTMQDVDKRAICCREHAIQQLHQRFLIIDNDNRQMHELIQNQQRVYGQKISELMRYNSEQVVRRREINAHRLKLLAFVIKARDVFNKYARNHQEKADAMDAEHQTMHDDAYMDRMTKAQTNNILSCEADEALIWESEPGAMGRP